MKAVMHQPPNSHAGNFRARPPAEIMEIARAREQALSRVLMAYVSSGLIFMLLPGTFLGVWNLLQISGRQSAGSVSPAWLQAHGHAQIFGWIGSFILGIGFHSIPKRRGDRPPPTRAAWICWIGWTALLRVSCEILAYQGYAPWAWNVLPASAVLELLGITAFAINIFGTFLLEPSHAQLQPVVTEIN